MDCYFFRLEHSLVLWELDMEVGLVSILLQLGTFFSNCFLLSSFLKLQFYFMSECLDVFAS